MFKNKTFLIVGVVVLVLALAGGGYYFFASKAAPEEEESIEDDVVQTLKAEEIGLKMTISPDKKKVKFSIEKSGDIRSVEYQVTYEADSTAQERSEGGEDRVQRGITGEEEVDGSTYESQWLDLGSCSRNVCRYDSGVEKVDLLLKIVKKDGKTYAVEDSLEL